MSDLASSIALPSESKSRLRADRSSEPGLRKSGLHELHRSGAPASAACDPQPRDPMAYPAYKPRAEGSAQPIYQIHEEPAEKPVRALSAAVSKKIDLDIAAFVTAVASAFPRPSSPKIPRVLRAWPATAARSSRLVPGECIETHDVDQDDSDQTAYDPILAGEELIPGEPEAGLHSAEASHPGKAVLEQDVQAHERTLIDAVIEPREPVARPRLPAAEEVAAAAEAMLSPFQRARMRRPLMVKDCHGRMTRVSYRVEPDESV